MIIQIALGFTPLVPMVYFANWLDDFIDDGENI
jgi:hypothetical protein